MVGLGSKNPELKVDEEFQLSSSKLDAWISKSTFVNGTGTPTPVQTSILVFKEDVIIGFFVMVNTMESSASAEQGASFKAFNVSVTEPIDLSKVPGS